MSPYRTQIDAAMCAFHMWRDGYTPQTIINVGLGNPHEIRVWRWLYPDATIVGIDPRDRRRQRRQEWNVEFVQAAASNETHVAVAFCMQCRSMYCKEPEHNGVYFRPVQTVRIDTIPLGPKPYFIWMDVEGGELDALEGAIGILPETKWLNVETSDWVPGHANAVQAWLAKAGYKMILDHENSCDKLYRRRDG